MNDIEKATQCINSMLLCKDLGTNIGDLVAAFYLGRFIAIADQPTEDGKAHMDFRILVSQCVDQMPMVQDKEKTKKHVIRLITGFSQAISIVVSDSENQAKARNKNQN